MQISGKEYIDYMTFKKKRRPIFIPLFGFMPGVEEEWYKQGANEEEINFEAFGFDTVQIANLEVNTGAQGGFTEKIIEETDECVIKSDSYGRKTKLYKTVASIPLPLDFPVKDFKTWEKIKPLFAYGEERFGKDWLEKAKKSKSAGFALSAGIPGGYYTPRDLMGDDTLYLSYYTQPQLIEDMLKTMGSTAYKVLDIVSSRVQIDILHVGEDLAGKNGPLIGPNIFTKFINPYYRKIWDMLQARGCSLFLIDSDGNLEAIIDALLDAGINVLQPCEPAAGMDIVKIRKKYGNRLALSGGLDKMVLLKSKEEIIEEMEYKIPSMMEIGGYEASLDHRVVNGTTLDNYRFYTQKVKEIIDREMQRRHLSE